MTSQTVVFTGPQQVAVEDRPVPDLGPGQLLLETTVSLISTGTESWCFRGVFDPGTSWAGWVTYPFLPGYSNVARVLAVSEEVSAYAPGDRVVGLLPHQQYSVTDPGALLGRIPDGISDDEASWAVLSFVAQTGVRRAAHRLGDCAVVIGLGPLGQLACGFLRASGCREILAIDTVGPRLEFAKQSGATATFLGSAADAKDFVLEHTAGRLADVVYDVTGAWQVLPLALPLARDFGKVVLLGDSPEPSKQCLTQDILARQVTLLGTHNSKLSGDQAEWADPSRQADLFFTYLLRRQMRVEGLITHRFRPEDAVEVYPMLQTRRAETMGVVFDWK